MYTLFVLVFVCVTVCVCMHWVLVSVGVFHPSCRVMASVRLWVHVSYNVCYSNAGALSWVWQQYDNKRHR